MIGHVAKSSLLKKPIMNRRVIKRKNSVLMMTLQKVKGIGNESHNRSTPHIFVLTLHPAPPRIDYVGTKINLWQSRFANTPGNLHPLRPLSLPAVSLFYPPKPSVTMQYSACSI